MIARLVVALAALTACNPAPRANDAPAAGAQDAMPLRYTPNNGVMPVSFGTLRELVVRPPFTYVGGQRFVLGGTADAEQHLFVVADDAKVVQRLYWIQIEELLPSATDPYDYSADSSVSFSGFALPANFRTYTAPPDPGSDRARAFAYLTERGYTIPTASGTRIRLVYLPETPARREVMLIYFESDASAAADSHVSLLERAAAGITLR